MNNAERKNDLFTNAMSNLMKDKLGVSIDLLTELIDTDSEDKLAYLARGSVYLKMNDTNKAIADFNHVIEIDANHPKAYHLRGLAHELAGDNDNALSDFNKAIDIDGEYGAAFYSRASLLTKMGQEESALEDMKMVNHLSNLNIENFANENNVWRSRQLQLEEAMESEMHR
ncbi:MAG: tetratricopeptide repeat protein [Desulfobacterales bacterium]|jgi:tetratricopeptide (TPR) repeat protein